MFRYIFLLLLCACDRASTDITYLSGDQDPIAAIEALGYEVIEDPDLEHLGAAYCHKRKVYLRDATKLAIAAHEWAHVWFAEATQCRGRDRELSEAIAYSAEWVFRGCVESEVDFFEGRGAHDLDPEYCQTDSPGA